MKIEYKILWFEDQFDDISATIEAVEEFLKEHGFKAVIKKEEVVTSERVVELALQLSGYNPHDLILFDYDLGGDGRSNGMEIAKVLRKHLYSDMVFYSGKSRSELRKLLYDNDIEGVFTAGRRSFPEDVEPIIEDQIKRISDVNMMRGIVMDEVSRFDRLLRELCVKLLESADLNTARNSLCKRMKRNGESMLKKSEKIECPIEGYRDVRTPFDLVKRGLLDLLSDSELRTALAESGLLHRLQNLRNRLAHIEGSLDNRGVMTLVDNEKEQFDFARFVEIRKDLQEAGELIQNEL